eukprot:364379-Chlamydomonas_euryale.AAC.5
MRTIPTTEHCESDRGLLSHSVRFVRTNPPHPAEPARMRAPAACTQLTRRRPHAVEGRSHHVRSTGPCHGSACACRHGGSRAGPAVQEQRRRRGQRHSPDRLPSSFARLFCRLAITKIKSHLQGMH